MRARPAAARRGHERGPNDDGGETQKRRDREEGNGRKNKMPGAIMDFTKKMNYKVI